jgi:excisionase family DNA binding protein
VLPSSVYADGHAPVGTSIAEKPTKAEKEITSLQLKINSQKAMENRFLSTQELGSLLGVTRQTIRNWIKKGNIKAFQIGQNLKIPTQEAVRILTHYNLPFPEWLEQNEKMAAWKEEAAPQRMQEILWAKLPPLTRNR